MDNPFWQFSLKVYGRNGVSAACLQIQAGFGADVNILLYLCWLSSRAIGLSKADITEIKAAADGWHHQIVVPLRQVRNKLKTDSLGADKGMAEEFRSSVKRIELKAEQLEQALLFGLDHSDRASTLKPAEIPDQMRLALETYLGELGSQEPDGSELQTLIEASLS